jgi:SHS2 domain-containing protein
LVYGGLLLSNKGYKYLEHTADIYIEAYGASLEQAFENAALASTEVMTDTEKIEPRLEETLEIEAHDLKALLYSWIEEFLIQLDAYGILYSKFKINEIKETETGFRLEAKIWGEEFNPKKHPQKLGIKAVTYHRMNIDEQSERVTVKFVLDV